MPEQEMIYVYDTNSFIFNFNIVKDQKLTRLSNFFLFIYQLYQTEDITEM